MNDLLEQVPAYCMENGSLDMMLHFSPKFLELYDRYIAPDGWDGYMDDATYDQGLA